MSNPNNEKGIFYQLFEKEVRSPDFMKVAMEKAGSKLTPDIAVNSIFLLIKSLDELTEWITKINIEYPNKYSKYGQFKPHVKPISAKIMCLMKFNEDLTLTQESMDVLREELQKYFIESGISSPPLPTDTDDLKTSEELQRIMSDPNNEEALFRYLLEAEMCRSTDVVQNLISINITPDMVFDLVDSEEFKKWAAEIYKNPNKRLRYIQFNHQVKDVLANVSNEVISSKDMTWTREIMDQLRENFKIHFAQLGENESFKQ